MIRFSCACGRLLQATEEMIGQKAICPVCNSEQVVPAEDQGLLQAAVPAPETAPAGRPPDEEQRPRRRDADDTLPLGRKASEARLPSFSTDIRQREETGPVAPVSAKAITGVVLGVLSFVGMLCTGIPAMLFGYLAMRDVSRSKGQLAGWGMGLTGLILGALGTFLFTPCIGAGVFWPIYTLFSETANQKELTENLQQIGIAMHGFHNEHNRFPGAAIRSKEGKPLLSWRVALLKYMGEDALLAQFHLDEPWDSENNRPLVLKMPKVFTHPLDRAANQSGLTHFQVCVGRGTVFENAQGLRMVDIPDGTANTAMVLEARTPVNWTEPSDLDFNPNGPLPAFGGLFPRGYYVMMSDGSVKCVDRSVSAQTQSLMIQRNDGIPITLPR